MYAYVCRCQVNGRMVWLCEEHKEANKSMTESRYAGRINAQPEANIPIAGIYTFLLGFL